LKWFAKGAKNAGKFFDITDSEMHIP
jgi:hypothetical protein